MRRTVTVVATLSSLALALPTIPAAAEESTSAQEEAPASQDDAKFGEVSRGRGGEDGRLSRALSIGPAVEIVRPTSSRRPTDGMVWAGLPRLSSYVDEQGDVVFCRAVQWVRVLPNDRADRVRNANAVVLGLFGRLPELQGHDPNHPCPTDPTETIPPVVVQHAVLETIEDQLPRPTLEVPPGYALTGMPAYLVTNHQLDYGPVTHTVDLGITVVDVTVTATGTTHVDWGDGHAETYHTPGTPWPDGQVRHTYIDTGTVTITATDTWQVTYQVPALGIEDSVTAPLAPRSLEGFEVQQLQAVRTSRDR
jgi:hypothetical protein